MDFCFSYTLNELSKTGYFAMTKSALSPSAELGPIHTVALAGSTRSCISMFQKASSSRPTVNSTRFDSPGDESNPSKSFQLSYRKSDAGSPKADVKFYNFIASARSSISYRGRHMQRLRRLLVEPASTHLRCAQLQRRVSKLGIAESVTKRKERCIRFVHIARMIFFVVVAGWTTEINAVRRTSGIQCIIVEWFLAHAAGHGNGELPARTHIAEKCSHERRSRLHSRKPSLQNRRDVIRGPS